MVTPYHNICDVDFDAVHYWSDALVDIVEGRTDSFMKQAYSAYALSVTPSNEPG
jgi:hypothetical protein